MEREPEKGLKERGDEREKGIQRECLNRYGKDRKSQIKDLYSL